MCTYILCIFHCVTNPVVIEHETTKTTCQNLYQSEYLSLDCSHTAILFAYKITYSKKFQVEKFIILEIFYMKFSHFHRTTSQLVMKMA